MAENKDNKEIKDAGAAQGAGTHPENISQENIQIGELTVEVEAPKWAVELKDICLKVLDKLEKKEGNNAKEQTATPSPITDVKINKKAKYVVAKGRAFHSSVSGGLVGEGVDVSGLEPDRLKTLIAQGIAVEESED